MNQSVSYSQNLHGNIFDIDTLTGSRFGAFGISNNPAFYTNINHYIVNPSTNPFCNPLRIGRNNGAQIFSANQSNYWQDNGWFEPDTTGINYVCTYDSINCSDDIYRLRDMPDSLFTSNLTLNSSDSTIYEWDAARYLSEQILNDSTLLQDSLFNAYYQSLVGTSVVQFSEVSRYIGKAYQLNSADSLALAQLNTSYTISYTAYQQNDSLIKVQGLNNTLQYKKDSLKNELRFHRTELTRLHSALDSVRTVRLDSIEQINNQLQSGTLQSLNEQTINQLRIRLQKREILNTSETTLLYFIAMQCPYSGGASVYTARSLYAVVNDTLDFEDDVICSNNEWYFRKDNETSSSNTPLLIYPNPTTNTFQLSGLESGVVNQIQMVDSYGNILRHIVTKENNLIFSTAELSAGVYIIKVINRDVQYLKLIVIK